MIYDSIVDTIGRTPVVRIHRLAPPSVTMYVKIEAFNPAGSVKDRLALGLVLDAEQRGELKPGQTASAPWTMSSVAEASLQAVTGSEGSGS